MLVSRHGIVREAFALLTGFMDRLKTGCAHLETPGAGHRRTGR